MDKLKINGKEYKVKVTWKDYKRLLKRPGLEEDADPGDLGQWMIDTLWDILVPRWFGIKPFITKNRMEKRISAKELLIAQPKITEMMAVEDKDSGN